MNWFTFLVPSADCQILYNAPLYNFSLSQSAEYAFAGLLHAQISLKLGLLSGSINFALSTGQMSASCFCSSASSSAEYSGPSLNALTKHTSFLHFFAIGSDMYILHTNASCSSDSASSTVPFLIQCFCSNLTKSSHIHLSP